MLVPMSGAALWTGCPPGQDCSRTTGRPHRVVLLVFLLLAALSLTGCVGPPPSIDPSGVDELQIPTPAPDPADFVATVDNAWFPLAPGSVWTYRSTATKAGDEVGTGNGTGGGTETGTGTGAQPD